MDKPHVIAVFGYKEKWYLIGDRQFVRGGDPNAKPVKLPTHVAVDKRKGRKRDGTI